MWYVSKGHFMISIITYPLLTCIHHLIRIIKGHLAYISNMAYICSRYRYVYIACKSAVTKHEEIFRFFFLLNTGVISHTYERLENLGHSQLGIDKVATYNTLSTDIPP